MTYVDTCTTFSHALHFILYDFLTILKKLAIVLDFSKPRCDETSGRCYFGKFLLRYAPKLCSLNNVFN